ncbi:hypothetical protein M432DRAFT_627309, partial [Thermoascus aurantiacus ATCC 26904]
IFFARLILVLLNYQEAKVIYTTYIQVMVRGYASRDDFAARSSACQYDFAVSRTQGDLALSPGSRASPDSLPPE